jgi:hypothetical protein
MTGMRVHALGKGVVPEMSHSDAASMLVPTKPRARVMRLDWIMSLWATKARSTPSVSESAH